MKNIQIGDKLHRQVKLFATMHGVTIKEWTERVLQNALAAEGMMLVDPGTEYHMKGENDA